MNNQSKRGFSLVEVMILFAVLAVLLAASLPLITKKSKSVPAKASHGVYRCIALENGKYLEETYNSFRLLKQNANADSCDFRVPNASVYKIDLYSAGAGGTKYAAYRPVQNDVRTADFTMSDAAEYAKTGTFTFSNKTGVQKSDMPYDLNDTNIRTAFNDEIIKTSAYSGDAGSGGSAYWNYYSPATNVMCSNINDAKAPYKKAVDNAKDSVDSAEAKYKAEEEKYTNKIKEYESQDLGYQSKIDQNNSDIKIHEENIVKLKSFIDKVDDLMPNYTTLANGGSLDEMQAAYNKMISISSYDIRSTNFYADAVYQVFQNEAKILDWYTFNASSDTTYQGMANPLYNNTEIRPDVVKWMDDKSKHKRYEYQVDPDTKEFVLDENGNKIKIGQRDATKEELFKDLRNQADPDRVLASTGDYLAKLKQISDNGQMAVDNAEAYVTTINARIAALEADNKTQDSNQKDVNKKKEDLISSMNNDKNSQSGTLYDLNKKIQDAKADYDDKSKKYDEVDQNAQRYYHPSVYDNAKGLTVDIPKSSSSYAETEKQIDEFCRNVEVYKEFYKTKNYGWQNDKLAILYDGVETVSQTGGDKGLGKWVELEYTLSFDDKASNAYNNLARFESWEAYPYVKYIGDLYANVENRGYELNACTSLTNMNSDTCSPGAITNASAGAGAYSQYQKTNNTEMTRNGNKMELRGERGKHVEKFVAYHVPDFNNYNYSGVGSYISVQDKTEEISGKNLAATGGYGGVVGYIESDKKYTTGKYEENLAWQTFKGENEHAGLSKATKGKDAVQKTTNVKLGGKYELRPASGNNAQEPRIEQRADMWTKEYSLGQAGTIGKHLHFQVASMGTRCEITIPHAGPTFEYMDLLREAASHPEGVTPETYLVNKKAEYENRLRARIACFDNHNLPVFDQDLEGGSYNIEPSGWTQPFYWYKDVGIHSVQLGGGGPSNYDGLTTRWAKIFYKIDALTNARVMKLLSDYDIGNAGTATGLTDACNAPKGIYQFKTYRMVTTNGANWSDQLITGLNKSYTQNFSGKMGENQDGLDCYKDNNGEGSYSDARVFDEDAHALEQNMMTEADRLYYHITPPAKAGGGAIVIVW